MATVLGWAALASLSLTACDRGAATQDPATLPPVPPLPGAPVAAPAADSAKLMQRPRLAVDTLLGRDSAIQPRMGIDRKGRRVPRDTM